ncbi:MAG: hypothetical protein LBQ79_11490 [Deltaproteobacteria bacterium]|jgi:hypothetical protein|nr:hypothetical protein [Deltaproteobacteria bacterium]
MILDDLDELRFMNMLWKKYMDAHEKNTLMATMIAEAQRRLLNCMG